MTKLDGKTLDLATENIEQLRQVFPNVFEEGRSTLISTSSADFSFNLLGSAYRACFVYTWL